MGDITKKKKSIYIVAFIILWMCFACVNFVLFFRQSQAPRDGSLGYFSDIHFYVDALEGIDNGDDYTYPVFFVLSALVARITSIPTAVAIVATFLNVLCIPLLTFFFYQILKDTDTRYAAACSLVIPYILMLVSMVFLPGSIKLPGMSTRYLGVFTANPWHNHTYFAARPFAIASFILFRELYEKYKERVEIRKLFLFALFLLLATLTKPSFSLVFGTAAYIVVIFNLIRYRLEILKNTIVLGLGFIPTIITLGYQYVWGPFGSHSSQGAEAGIGFNIGYIWSLYSKNIPVSILLAFFFPIVVFIINYREVLLNKCYRFALLIGLAGLFEFLCLYEKGTRFWHANFAWGYMYAIFFVFVESIVVLLQSMMRKEKGIIAIGIQWLALLIHFICGCLYFLYLFRGGSYIAF